MIWSSYIAGGIDQVMIEAKASLGFSPSTAIEDITEEKMQMKFGQKLVEVNFDIMLLQRHTTWEGVMMSGHFSVNSQIGDGNNIFYLLSKLTSYCQNFWSNCFHFMEIKIFRFTRN